MKYTILLVDDQPDERDAMADLLRRHHYVVECAANGQEALERLWRTPLPALLLLDLNMPVMDGWELLYHVAQDRVLRRVPAVVISAAPVVHDEIEVPPLVTFMAKPVRPVAMMKVVAHMLRMAALAAAPTACGAVVGTTDDVDTDAHVAARCDPSLAQRERQPGDSDGRADPEDGGAVYGSPAMLR